MEKRDLRFTTCPVPPTPPAPAPVIALLIECSNSSLVTAFNFPTDSLKLLGEVVAKERSCKVVWVVIEVTVVDIIGGGNNELFDKREIVGCKIPNASVLNKEYHPHLKKTLLKVKQKTYDALHIPSPQQQHVIL